MHSGLAVNNSKIFTNIFWSLRNISTETTDDSSERIIPQKQ